MRTTRSNWNSISSTVDPARLRAERRQDDGESCRRSSRKQVQDQQGVADVVRERARRGPGRGRGGRQGKTVAAGVEFYLAAASAEVQAKAEQTAIGKRWSTPARSRCRPAAARASAWAAARSRPAKSASARPTATSRAAWAIRNGLVYLGSPAVVAASALAGYICVADEVRRDASRGRLAVRRSAKQTAGGRRGRDHRRLPRRGAAAGSGSSTSDNLNTDGIYAGKHTYNDAMTPEQMAAVIFENYDPKFSTNAKPGDVIVSGYNFGTGSSREQAATALKYFGIPCVIAASFQRDVQAQRVQQRLRRVRVPGAGGAPAGDVTQATRRPRWSATSTIDYGKRSLTIRRQDIFTSRR